MPKPMQSGDLFTVLQQVKYAADDVLPHVRSLPPEYRPAAQAIDQLLSSVDRLRETYAQTLAAMQSQSVMDYRTLFNAIDEGFCVIEMLFDADRQPVDYRFLEVNPAFEKHTGIQNAVNRRMREIAPQHETHWFEIYGRVATTGEAIRFENPAHQLGRHYDVYAFRVGDPNEHRVGVLFNDVTERKRLETARLSLLRREQDARFQAERAVAMQRLFLGMISHELRTPLASIKGFSSSLLATDVTFSPEQAREFIGIIDQEADQLSELIDQLLDVVRMQAGHLQVLPVLLPFADIVAEAMPELQMLTQTHQLQVTLPDSLPPVLADARRISQVLVNLVGNAARYSPPGSNIVLDANFDTDKVRVNVRDEGVGIPKNERTLVFEVFHQVLHDNAGPSYGTGLGLAICKGIVEAHGGSIWVEDAAEPGTTISFTLPSVPLTP